MESNSLENSLIHLLDAVDRLDETIPDILYLKYAVVHLWNGIELLLDNGLCASYGIDLDEYGDVLNKIRNDFEKIERSQFMGSKVQITSNLVQVWPFIIDLISKNFESSPDAYTQNLFNDICDVMDSHLQFIRDIKTSNKEVMANKLTQAFSDRPLKCPKCLQDAIPLLSNKELKFSCAFCGHVVHWQQLAAECGSYADYLGPFNCPNCSSQGALKTKDGWICLSCCHKWPLERIDICHECGKELVWHQKGEPYCKQCQPVTHVQ